MCRAAAAGLDSFPLIFGTGHFALAPDIGLGFDALNQRMGHGAAISYRPSAIGHQLSATSRQPRAADSASISRHHSIRDEIWPISACEQWPSRDGHQQSALGHQPTAESRQPRADSHRAANSEHALPLLLRAFSLFTALDYQRSQTCLEDAFHHPSACWASTSA
jgi:hypothetical protein